MVRVSCKADRRTDELGLEVQGNVAIAMRLAVVFYPDPFPKVEWLLKMAAHLAHCSVTRLTIYVQPTIQLLNFQCSSVATSPTFVSTFILKI